MQLLDELSMIYTTCFMFYATFCHFREGRFHPKLALALVSLAAFITLYYHYLQDPVFHQNAYAILTTIVLTRSMWIMEKNLRPMVKQEAADDPTSIKQVLAKMWVMVAFGLTVFLLGFVVWGMDNKYCTQLIRWRREVGLPWGVFLEGHGWW
jgi:dihydroceramidase